MYPCLNPRRGSFKDYEMWVNRAKVKFGDMVVQRKIFNEKVLDESIVVKPSI